MQKAIEKIKDGIKRNPGMNQARKRALEATELNDTAICDMSVEQVQSIAGRPVKVVDVPIGWRTHSVGDDGTTVWLGFSYGKLKRLQVEFPIELQRNAALEEVHLCNR